MISNLSNQLSINQLYIMYNDIRYIKLSGQEKEQKKIFNIQSESDILMVVSEEEYDTLESLYDESGKNSFLPPWVISSENKNLEFSKVPYLDLFGLYVIEDSIKKYNKNYQYIIWEDKEIYILIDFIKPRLDIFPFFKNLNIEEYFYKNIDDDQKLQLISDEEYSVFEHIFRSSYSGKPIFIQPFSRYIFSNHDLVYEKYIQLNFFTDEIIDKLNNL